MKGSSTAHYLVELINYITVIIDLQKAFDIDHTTLIEKMSSLGSQEGWIK